MTKYKLAVASDHSGIYLKDKIISKLSSQGIKILDLGTDSEERVDYPDYSKKLVEEIVDQSCEYGILISANGIGMSISANRSSSVRAALCTSTGMAQKARLNYNANVLVIGSKITDDETSLAMIDNFLSTKFEGGRHKRRIDKIS